MANLPAELMAKDQRIDDLVAQAARLVDELSAIVADMKAILASSTQTRQRASEGEDRGRARPDCPG